MEKFDEWFKNPEVKNKLQNIDLSKSNDANLEEDYNIRRIIGKKEDVENTEKLEKMNEEALDFQDKQKEYFTDLKEKLYNIASIIQQKEDLLNQFERDKEKLKELNKKNFQLHDSFSLEDGNIPPSDLEKQIYFLRSQVDFLSKKINEENITEEDIVLLRKEYEKLNKKYETLSKAWFPEDPSLN